MSGQIAGVCQQTEQSKGLTVARWRDHERADRKSLPTGERAQRLDGSMVVRSYAGRLQEFANRRKGPKAQRQHGVEIMDGGRAKSLDDSMVARSSTGESQDFATRPNIRKAQRQHDGEIMDGRIAGACQQVEEPRRLDGSMMVRS
jgi:hypothetical protein